MTLHPLSVRRFLAALACALAGSAALALDGVVVDASTGRPIAQAQVVSGARWVRTDAQGVFHLPGEGTAVSARAPGYRRQSQPLPSDGSAARIALAPFRPKALYLSPYGIGDAGLRNAALALTEQTEVNALVIDLKGDRSIVPHPSAAYAAAGLGAQHPITVHDMAGLVGQLHARGLYLIARIVVFKDDKLAEAHPEWAVRTVAGTVWRDREELAWIDPFRTEAWGFALDVAEEAAQLGFDEVQFDYLRFPDASGLRFSQPDTEPARIAAITGFLDGARNRLMPYNVTIAADVFGYICWNENDTRIGQQLEAIIGHVDVLSPMLYPSGFSFGIPGYSQPVAAPYEIVYRSLQRALRRTQVSSLHFRPWLQAFRDYAFDRREFDADEIRAQIDAAEALGTDGWMLWNAHNRYGTAGLKPAAAH
ncbi:putative glycoside hydrolase [Ideonella sp.]|uniref:putative glycoside hydrolase n=1 Tax=Ideonella sp. TaxID=1929293 RepID=UPI002B49FA26|nr:putative glycoside hydrolase [Ideonella sp.]HJV71476.1 putative glycoside hydrolase [Ideonella sp.]